MEWFQTILLKDPILSALTILYFLSASIATFDIRLIQAKRIGNIPEDENLLPTWTAIFMYLEYLSLLVIFFLHWRYAIQIWIIKFLLQVLPVLETLGNLICGVFFVPFRSKKELLGKVAGLVLITGIVLAVTAFIIL